MIAAQSCLHCYASEYNYIQHERKIRWIPFPPDMGREESENIHQVAPDPRHTSVVANVGSGVYKALT